MSYLLDGFNTFSKSKLHLSKILTRTIEIFPDHKKALVKSINSHSENEYILLEKLAIAIYLLGDGNIDSYIHSYKWMLDIFMEEHLEFIRTNHYRRKTFKQAYDDIYSDNEYMRKYMEGLLLSQLFWVNHAKSYLHFTDFINNQIDNFNLLEIGPGHGLYLALAVNDPKCIASEAWDISSESLRQTASALKLLKVKKEVKLFEKNILSTNNDDVNNKFDLIVISEILEHIEDPCLALRNMTNLLNDKGILYINFPVNSPSPDHIYLLRSIEEVENMVQRSGFDIATSYSFPASGYTLKQAVNLNSTISCVITATKSSEPI